MAMLQKWARGFWNDIRPSIYWTAIVWIATGGTFGQLTKALLITYTRIPHVWITPIWLFATALFGAIGMWVVGKWAEKPTQPRQKEGGSSGLVKTVVDLSIAEEFYKHQDYRLTRELEEEIKKAMVNLKGEERERMFVRLLTATLWGVTFSNTWSSIYRSQIKALISLNRGPSTRNDFQIYYNEAAASYPAYATLKFDTWLGFLRNSVLIKEQDGQIFITVRGQAFLTTMIQMGYSESDRLY